VNAWAAGDVEGTLACFSEDAVYTLHVDGDALPFAGQQRGKAELKAALEMMRAEFDYVLYRPFPATVDGNRVRHQVEFIYRHRASGEELTGRFRSLYTVENGLITRCDEYHDAERIKAFARLAAAAERGD
jgi:ketosteroid isomerase-like protein